MMKTHFLGFFHPKRKTDKNEFSIVRHTDDIEVEIRSDTIDISTD